MKIVHVGLESPTVRRGGLNIFLSSLVAAQQDNGHQVDVIQVGDGISPSASWVQRWRVVARQVRRNDAEVIDVHFAAMAWWAVLSGALRGRPLVVHFQGPWAKESAWTGQRGLILMAKKAMERVVLRRADVVITLSHAFATTAITDYGVSPTRIEIVPPGVPAPLGISRAQAREQLDLSPSDRLMVAVRRLVPRMGLQHAIEALVDLPEWTLVIAGVGPALDELTQCAQRYEVADRVKFLGAIDDDHKALWMAAANVCIVPSVAHEGFGLVVGESLAAGTPVVVAPVDGLRDAARLLPGVTPMASHEASDVSRAVREAAAGSVDPRSLEEWSWAAIARRTVDVYESAADARPRLCVVLDHTAELSGGELALRRLVAAMDRHHWRVHVILATDGPLRGELESAGATVEVVPLDEAVRTVSRDKVGRSPAMWKFVRYCATESRRLRQLEPAVVVANSLKAIVYGSVATWRGVPFVAYVRDTWSEPYLSRRTARVLRALTALRADGVIANSAATLADVGRGVAIASPLDERCLTVPLLAGSPDVMRIALVGRLAPWKGQDFVLEVLQRLPELPWQLVIAGDALFGEAEYRDTLLQRVANDDRITYVGHVDDVSSVLAQCDVVIHGSLSREPFGNVIVEALAAGRIVIAPRDAGASEFLTAKSTGVLYERANADSLREAILDAWQQRDEWPRWTRSARESVSTLLPHQVAAQFEAALEEVAR